MTSVTMQSAGDTDWFKLDLTAGKTYRITTTGLDEAAFYDIVSEAEASDYAIDVNPPNGTKQNGTITFTADTTGDYEFSASDSTGRTGAYTVTATTVANSYTLAADKTLAVSGADKATMESAGDTDWFKINLVAGKTYTFKTSGLDELAEYDIVPVSKAADGPISYQTSTGIPATPGEVTFTADASGAYEFKVYDLSGKTGAYTLSDAVVTNTYTLAADKTLAVGATDTATMQAAGDTDWFKIDLTAGKTYSFTAAGLDGEEQLSVVPAIGASDRGVQVDGFGLSTVQLTFTADTTGVYEVSLNDGSGKTGAYTVSDKVVTNTYALANQVTLAVNATDKATIQSVGDTDWFKISLVAGKTYTFKTTGLDLGGQFDIVPAADAVDFPLPVQSFTFPAEDGVYTYTADVSGVYEASIYDISGKTGAYTLSDAVVTNTYALANDVTLAVNGSDKATMQGAGDTDWFKIDLTAGKTYTFTVTGLDDQTQLYLYKASGTLDIPVDASSAKSSIAASEITFTADTTSVYELSVSDWSAMTGAYTVSDKVVTNTYTLAAGVTVAAGATRPTPSATTPFLHAMAGLGADAGAVQEGLAANIGGATTAFAGGAHAMTSGRANVSWA